MQHFFYKLDSFNTGNENIHCSKHMVYNSENDSVTHYCI